MRRVTQVLTTIRTMKKLTRKQLIKKLDRLVSEYVRKRDGHCVTCANPRGLPLTAGHLFSRVAHSARWNLLNIHAQCTGCNMYHEHNPHRFTSWFIQKFGLSKYEMLHACYSTTLKHTTQMLEFKCQYMQRKIKGLK